MNCIIEIPVGKHQILLQGCLYTTRVTVTFTKLITETLSSIYYHPNT